MSLQLSNTCLRAPLAEDIFFLQGLRNDMELQSQLMSLPRPNSPDKVREWLNRIANDERSVFFVIHEHGATQAIGFIQVREMDFIHGHGSLGICLEAQARGRGHGGAAVRLVQNYCKSVFGLRKLILQVLASNEGATRLYQRLGWKLVGCLERHFYHKGSYHDVCIMECQLAD